MFGGKKKNSPPFRKGPVIEALNRQGSLGGDREGEGIINAEHSRLVVCCETFNGPKNKKLEATELTHPPHGKGVGRKARSTTIRQSCKT